MQLNLPIDIQGTTSYGAPVTLLGVGSSGAVFRLEKLSRLASVSELSSAIALKVSWDATGNLIRQECATLRELDGIPHVPRCLDLLRYTSDRSSTRTIMAMVPVIDDSVSSFDDLADPQNAVYQILETAFEMLRRGVYTVDVQWLLSKQESSVLFIDFTERTDDPIAFLSEIVAGIPSDKRPMARSMLHEIAKNHAVDGNMSSTTVSFGETIDIFLSLLEGE